MTGRDGATAGEVWLAVMVGAAACYAAKLAGLCVPQSVLADRRVQLAAGLLPVALLSILVVSQTFVDGSAVVVDERAAGLGVAIAAIALRAPFLVVIIAAAAATALLRQL